MSKGSFIEEWDWEIIFIKPALHGHLLIIATWYIDRHINKRNFSDGESRTSETYNIFLYNKHNFRVASDFDSFNVLLLRK